MRNRKGYAGLMAIVAVVMIAALWMGYEFRKNWLADENLDLSKELPSGNNSPDAQPKSVNGQLEDLRRNVQNIQDAKNKEITDELNR